MALLVVLLGTPVALSAWVRVPPASTDLMGSRGFGTTEGVRSAWVKGLDANALWDRRRRQRLAPERRDDLGQERSKYFVSETYLARGQRLGRVLIVAGVAGLGIAVLMGVRPGALWWAGLGPAIIGVGFLFLGGMVHNGRARVAGLQVSVYERGFKYVLRGRETAFPWDDVTTYLNATFNQNAGRRDLRVRFESRSGDVHRLRIDSDQLPELHRLQFDLARASLVSRQGRGAQALWDQGDALTFGPLEVSQRGIRYGRRVEEWSDVEEARAENGSLVIRLSGRNLRWVIPLRRVPDALLMLTLIRPHLIEPAEFSDLTKSVRPRP